MNKKQLREKYFNLLMLYEKEENKYILCKKYMKTFEKVKISLRKDRAILDHDIDRWTKLMKTWKLVEIRQLKDGYFKVNMYSMKSGKNKFIKFELEDKNVIKLMKNYKKGEYMDDWLLEIGKMKVEVR